MWDKLKELIKQYSEISRDARTGGISSSIRDIDNMSLSDSEKTQRKQSLGKDLLIGGLGDAGEAYQATKYLADKNYKAAGISAGLLLLPGAMSSVLKPMKSAFKALDEVPEYAFKPRRTPLDEVRTMVQPSKQQVKFQDDVVKGAYFARRHSAPTPSMKEFDFDEMYDPSIFRQGYESEVTVVGDQALKFNRGRWLDADMTPAGYKGMKNHPAKFSNIEQMTTEATEHLKDVNRLWYSEPQSLVGYWKNWRGEHIPVFAQRAMDKPLTGVNIEKLKDINRASSIVDLQLVDDVGSVAVFDAAPVQFRIPSVNAKSRVPFTFNSSVVTSPGNLTPGQVRQVEYVLGKGKNSILKNNIFSENDLLPPLDAHTGNFMFDKEGVLRAIDIHKKGGEV